MPPHMIYTPEILRELASLALEGPPEETADNAQEWYQQLQPMHRHAYALALLDVGGPISVFDELLPDEVIVQDYWKATPYKSEQFVRVRFLEVKVLDQWVLVRHEALRHGHVPRGLVFPMSAFSYEKLVEEFDAQGLESLPDAVRRWVQKHHLDYDSLFDVNGRAVRSINMPIPHCLLICAGTWDRWSIPVPTSKRTFVGLGLGLLDFGDLNVQRLRRDASALSQSLEASDAVDLLTPMGIHLLQNTLRRLYAAQPTEDLAKQIVWLQRRRDILIEGKLKSTQRAFEMETVVKMLMLAGHLRTMRSLDDALRYAVACAVRDPALLKHVLSNIGERSVPSSTTIYRHQLTIHMGYCVLESEITTRLLQQGCVRYLTVDSSPQGHIDWVMHGTRTITNDLLVPAFHAANRMATTSLDEEERKRIAKELAPMLQWVTGVPTGVGSGRQSVGRKAHALVHSTRLFCSSWKEAAAVTNRTGFIVGDQGVECNLAFFKRSMRKLLGRWIVDEDEGKDVLAAGDEDKAADAPDEFVFREEEDDIPDQIEPELEDEPFEFAIRDEEEEEIGDRVPADPVPPEVEDAYMIDLTSTVFYAGILHVAQLHKRSLYGPRILAGVC